MNYYKTPSEFTGCGLSKFIYCVKSRPHYKNANHSSNQIFNIYFKRNEREKSLPEPVKYAILIIMLLYISFKYIKVTSPIVKQSESLFCL
jgi:uncharacterized membrane protein YbaN (DUF454 family)